MAGNNLEPPYYVVIFTFTRTDNAEGYDETFKKLVTIVENQPGFLGVESAKDVNGFGVTLSYWRDLDSIQKWGQQTDHKTAMRAGMDQWYSEFHMKIAMVEEEYDFNAMLEKKGKR